MTFLPKTFSCLAFLTLPLVSDAAIVARYDFEASTPAAAARNSTDTDPDSIAKALTPSALLSPQSNRSSSSSINHYYVRTEVTSNSKSDALQDGSYFSFEIEPVAGTPLSLSNLTFLSATTAGSEYAFTGTVFVRSSVDGFATDLAEFTRSSTTATTAANYVSRAVDLSGAAFQNLTAPVTFRLYFWDDSSTLTSTNTGVVHRVDDIIVNSVPEPGSVGLLGLGALSLLVRRRR